MRTFALRTWLLSFLGAAMLAFSSGCDARSACEAERCVGCCDALGICHRGETPTHCGLAGSACRDCGAEDQCNGGFCLPPPTPECTPKSCTQMDADCGNVPDGCGGTIQCGECETGTCGGAGVANRCGEGTCEPSTCEALGKNCDQLSDGCADVLQCGECSGGLTCGGGGTPNVCGAVCVPTSCMAQGKDCGPVPNGCGGTLECGDCSGPNTCGGGGTPNVCGTGCTPTSCIAQGKDCGTRSDGCGGMLECGTCAGSLTCGGGGSANVCGASCEKGCPTGYACDAFGVCRGGSPSALTLNVTTAPTATVSGNVRLNGATPTKTSECTSPRVALEVELRETSTGASFSAELPCTTSTFDWSLAVPHGSYRVSVRHKYVLSSTVLWMTNLPQSQQALVVNPALSVGGNLTNQTLNVVAPMVSGTVRLNGATPTKTSECTASRTALAVEFRETSSGVSFASDIPCTTTTFSWSLALPHGSYEVSVRHKYVISSTLLWMTNLPQSQQPLRVIPALSVGGSLTNQTLNVVASVVSGTVRLNGATPTKTSECTGSRTALEVELRDASSGVSLAADIPCTTTTFNWSLAAPHGSYEVSIRHKYVIGSTLLWMTNLPESQQPLVVRSALAVNGMLSGQVLNVLAATVSGTVRLNGAMPTKSPDCFSAGTVRVEFDETSTGFHFATTIPCSTTTFAWSLTVPHGTYRVSVRNQYVGGAASPWMTNLPESTELLVMKPSLPVSGALTNQTLNVIAATVSGTVRLNGAIPTKSPDCFSAGTVSVHFDDTTSGASFATTIPCDTTNFDWSLSIPHGTYRVGVRNRYVIGASSPWMSNLPRSSSLIVVKPTLTVGGNLTHQTLNVVTAVVSGTVRLNGAMPTKSPDCFSAGTVAVELVETSTGASFGTTIPCSTTTFSWSLAVPHGTYRMSVRNQYVSGASSPWMTNLPETTAALLIKPSVSVSGNLTNQTLNLVTVPVSGSVRLNGAMPTKTSECTSGRTALRVEFRDGSSGVSFTTGIPCSTTNFAWSFSVPPGTYRVTVENLYVISSGVLWMTNLPTTQTVLFDAVEISGS